MMSKGVQFKLKDILSSFKGVSKVFKRSFNEISRVVQKSVKGI